MTAGACSDAPRVLAIADVAQSYVAAWRVHAPLAALKRIGRVADYVVTDAALGGLPRRGRFDVVWLQRGVDEYLTRRLVDLMPRAFLLDIDDHLLCRPEYLRPEEFPAPASVAEALAGARVVTVTSARLGRLLARRSGIDLADRLVVCPNATAFAPARRSELSRPVAMLLTQGHRLALTESAEEVLTAIGDFGARHALPICYFGPRLEGLSPQAVRALRSVVPAGEMPLGHYHTALASLPAMLAVAPLETRGDPSTLEFVSGKSDVKMVEYGGFGHPGVYSDAAPYADSDLECGQLAANTYEAWSIALERACDSGWRLAGEELAAVRARREISSVAERHWAAAIDAAQNGSPVECRDIARIVDRIGARVRSVRSRAAWHLWRARGRHIPAPSG